MIQGVCNKHLIRAADKETSAFHSEKSHEEVVKNIFAFSESILSSIPMETSLSQILMIFKQKLQRLRLL